MVHIMSNFGTFSAIPDIAFRVSCAGVFTAAIVMKLFFLVKAGVASEVTASKTYQSVGHAEGSYLFVLRSIWVVCWPLGIALYVVQPALMAGFSIKIAPGLRWFGILLGLVSLGFMWWTHASLGNNYAVELKVKANHQLVSHGPYHLVRHPMYTATFVAGLSCALISANLLLIAGAAIAAILYTSRIAYEEALLEDAFGEQYTHYKNVVTGRFIPGIY